MRVFFTSDGKFAVSLMDKTVSGDVSVADGRWHHFAVIRKSFTQYCLHAPFIPSELLFICLVANGFLSPLVPKSLTASLLWLSTVCVLNRFSHVQLFAESPLQTPQEA